MLETTIEENTALLKCTPMFSQLKEISALVKHLAEQLQLRKAKKRDLEIRNFWMIVLTRWDDVNGTIPIKNQKVYRKVKRGLPGFANGVQTSAIADTGAAANIISVKCAEEMQLPMKYRPCSEFPSLPNRSVRLLAFESFRKKLTLTDTVSLRWAFAESPTEETNVLCHVLPNSTFELILGSGFLKATETLTKYRRRLTECVFHIASLAHLSHLDGESQYLRGMLADRDVAFAVPDTCADRNIMNFDYALRHNYIVNRQPWNRDHLLFADGTSQYTVGQVNTTWTFETGERIPVTFEVLENCSADVILGEDVLWNHNIFQKHVNSLVDLDIYRESLDMMQAYDLAPFTFVSGWQRMMGNMRLKSRRRQEEDLVDRDETPSPALEELLVSEKRRRAEWNYQYGFEGEKANETEKEAERIRRQKYEARRQTLQSRCQTSSERNLPRIPSIRTAPRLEPRAPPIYGDATTQPQPSEVAACMNRESRSTTS